MEHRNRSLRLLPSLISICFGEVGKSYSKLAKSTCLIREKLFSSLIRVPELLEVGSYAEGTCIQGSDHDCMLVLPDTTVQTSLETAEDLESTGDVFLLHTCGSLPGYARLRFLRFSDIRNYYLEMKHADIRDFLVHSKDGEFLSSKKFANFFASDLYGSGHRHGPCSTMKHVDVQGFLHGDPGAVKESDTANALQCNDWPVEAREWAARQRIHEWPQEYLIKKVADTKCHVVPVGNPLSKNVEHEWRISFILGERELVWSFNDTQLQCYVLLKKLVKLFLDKIAPDQISSYSIKTIMFWISEENEFNMWQPENILGCVETCLDRIQDSVSKKHLRHYFISQANLFGHKFENEPHRDQILSAIDDMKANLCSYVVKAMPSCFQWASGLEYLRADIYQRLCEHFDEILSTRTIIANSYFREQHKHLYLILRMVQFIDLKPEQVLVQLSTLNDLSEAVDPLFMKQTTHFLEIRLAMRYFRELVLNENEVFRHCIEEFVHFTPTNMVEIVADASEIDAMSGDLYLASLLFTIGDYSNVIAITLNLLHQHNKHLVYPGFCSKYDSIRLQSNGICIQEMGIPFVGEEKFVAYDVIFSCRDVYCVPYPVKFECALAELDKDFGTFIAIHPSVYAYFLLCYGQYITKQHSKFKETLDPFQKAVAYTEGGRKRYHALNLLSFCYLLDGNLQKAFELFKESLCETEKFSGKVANAAAYYIAIVLNDIFQKQKLAQGLYILYKRSCAIDV